MTIQVGEKIPSVKLKHLGESGMQDINTDELFQGKRVLMFAVPGAFTPTCSVKHVPSYIQNSDALRAKGVDQIICVSVNDPFVMREWGKASNVGDKIMMLSDGNAQLTKALGLDMDASANGLGTRSKRYAMLVEDGVVKDLQVEQPGAFEVSGGEHMLSRL